MDNWFNIAKFAVVAVVGIGAAIVAYVEFENRRRQQQQQQQVYGVERSSRTSQNQTNESLLRLREQRRQELVREQLIKEQRERDRIYLEESLRKVKEQKRLEEEKQKQLANDERIKQEQEEIERKKYEEFVSQLDAFSDTFDEEIGTSTERENRFEDFDECYNNQRKKHLKQEFRGKQNDKLKNESVARNVANGLCNVQPKDAANLNHTIHGSQNTLQLKPTVNTSISLKRNKKPLTAEQKAVRNQKRKMRKQRKKLETAQNCLNLDRDVNDIVPSAKP